MPYNSRRLWMASLVLVLFCLAASAQDRLKQLPIYSRYEKLSREISDSVKSGAISVAWSEDGSSFDFNKAGKRFRYQVEARTLSELASTNSTQKTNTSTNTVTQSGRNPRRAAGVARAHQYTAAESPDHQWKAFYRDHNLWLSPTNGKDEVAITSEGSEKSRIKFGAGNWVYGEELYQSTAIWWSSNSQQIAFYRFDENQVQDYYLALNQIKTQDTLSVEGYNKAGSTNPIVDLLVYDLASKQTVMLDVRSGAACDNSVVGHYVYGISWAPKGEELLFHRTDRLQKIMELCAADPISGKCRVIVREEWPASWTENLPEMRFLQDGQTFIWASERTGWKNYYLYDISGRFLCPLTQHNFEVADIVRVDEKHQRLFYTARSGINPMLIQLHCVDLDGQNDRRLTAPEFNHSVNVSPSGNCFIDIYQTHQTPAASCLRDSEGNLIAELAQSDTTKFERLAFRKVELFKFKAADEETDLFGLLHFPSNFSPHKRHPLLVSVYAGPATIGASENFTLPNALTELGFLVATVDSRSANGRGKQFLDAIYKNLGQVEIDDQAAGVRYLASRPYVDSQRVGIFGTSYGGTASLLCLLRYPEVFKAACSMSPVTDFRNYDTIYTERYLGLPQENPAAYDQVSAMTYARQLKGRLMLYYGTADDNVHPANTLQLVRALQQAGKSFDLQVGPDAGHGSLNRERMMEFFVDALK